MSNNDEVPSASGSGIDGAVLGPNEEAVVEVPRERQRRRHDRFDLFVGQLCGLDGLCEHIQTPDTESPIRADTHEVICSRVARDGELLDWLAVARASSDGGSLNRCLTIHPLTKNKQNKTLWAVQFHSLLHGRRRVANET